MMQPPHSTLKGQMDKNVTIKDIVGLSLIILFVTSFIFVRNADIAESLDAVGQTENPDSDGEYWNFAGGQEQMNAFRAKEYATSTYGLMLKVELLTEAKMKSSSSLPSFR